MEEARQVLDRLGRIEQLRRDSADAPHLLAEVRALLEEAERWVAREASGGDPGVRRAALAVERCRAGAAPADRDNRRATIALSGVPPERKEVVREAG